MSGFSTRDVISSAWKNVKGSKWPIWGVLLVLALIAISAGLLMMLVMTLFGIPIGTKLGAAPVAHTVGYTLIVVITEIVMIFLTAPLSTGAQMTALKRARGETISATTGFGYWPKWFPLGVTIIYFSIGLFILNIIFSLFAGLSAGAGAIWLATIIGILGFIAVLLFYTFFIFNLLFVADKGKGPFPALLCSAKAVAPHWFRVLLLWIFVFIVLVVTLLPLLLGLMCPLVWVKVLGVLVSIGLMVWTVPYMHLILSTTYNKLTGARRTSIN